MEVIYFVSLHFFKNSEHLSIENPSHQTFLLAIVVLFNVFSISCKLEVKFNVLITFTLNLKKRLYGYSYKLDNVMYQEAHNAIIFRDSRCYSDLQFKVI